MNVLRADVDAFQRSSSCTHRVAPLITRSVMATDQERLPFDIPPSACLSPFVLLVAKLLSTCPVFLLRLLRLFAANLFPDNQSNCLDAWSGQRNNRTGATASAAVS
jgi:hypothetical protein